MPSPAVLAAFLATAAELSPDAGLPSVRAVTLDAQEISAQSFGPTVQYRTISALDFEPDEHADIEDYRRFGDGYRGVNGVPEFPKYFAAPLELPNGATMEAICYLLYDDSPTDDIRIWVSITEVDPSPSENVPIMSDPSWDDGYFSQCFFFPSGWTYRSFENFDGDGSHGWLFWEVRLRLTASVIDQRFRGAFVKYRLDVSPAPATATFDDVGTGDDIFRYVEALNAAGISVGCAPDRFCPGAPVTRGQLAVLMARALGLHWSF